MDYLWKCYKVDFTDNHGSGMKMVNTIWYTLVLKALELSETVVFVLRKKQNQVSVLHLYHHLTTLSIVWLFSKFDGGMQEYAFKDYKLLMIFFALCRWSSYFWLCY